MVLSVFLLAGDNAHLANHTIPTRHHYNKKTLPNHVRAKYLLGLVQFHRSAFIKDYSK